MTDTSVEKEILEEIHKSRHTPRGVNHPKVRAQRFYD